MILAVTAMGEDPSDVVGYNMLTPLADFEQTVSQGINGPIFALQALAKYQDRKDVAESIEKGLEILSSRQDETGSYQFSSGEPVSSESVAQVIVALGELGISLDDSRFVKKGHTLMDALLKFKQADGGFSHLMDGESDLLATEQAFYALVAANRLMQGEASLYRMK